MAARLPFLTLSPHRDVEGPRILLLHSDRFPQIDSPTIIPDINAALHVVPPEGLLTLVYCHASIASSSNTTLLSVRAFRSLYETHVPLQIRSRIHTILALHVSAYTRSHVYLSTFGMQCGEYTKLKYCDLLSDLEPLVAVDSTLLGLSDIDFEYDEQMRYWVGRQHETPKAPDPSKPLIDVNNISISTPDTPAEPDDHGRASTSVQP